MNISQVLDYGVVGLCLAILILAWRILSAEQKRDKEPRKNIIMPAYVFMVFSFLLACLSAYVQLREQSHDKLLTQIQGCIDAPNARSEEIVKCIKIKIDALTDE